MFLKCHIVDRGFEENQWWGRWMAWVKARKSSIFIEGLVNNLARGWGVCGRLVKDKEENVCHLLFSCKGNSLKIITIHFWICFLISEAQELVRLYVQQAPGGPSVFLFWIQIPLSDLWNIINSKKKPSLQV